MRIRGRICEDSWPAAVCGECNTGSGATCSLLFMPNGMPEIGPSCARLCYNERKELEILAESVLQ